MREPYNKARGEVMLAVGERRVRLCVTLGALAELEAAFEVASFAELAKQLQHLSASDLIIVLSALAREDGVQLSRADIASSTIDPRAAAAAVAEAFSSAFGDA